MPFKDFFDIVNACESSREATKALNVLESIADNVDHCIRQKNAFILDSDVYILYEFELRSKAIVKLEFTHHILTMTIIRNEVQSKEEITADYSVKTFISVLN